MIGSGTMAFGISNIQAPAANTLFHAVYAWSDTKATTYRTQGPRSGE